MTVKIQETKGNKESIALIETGYIGKTESGCLMIIPMGIPKIRYVSYVGITDKEIDDALKQVQQYGYMDLSRYIFSKEGDII